MGQEGNTHDCSGLENGACGNVGASTYEPTFNKVTSVTDPLGQLSGFEYDAQGNLIQIRDALNLNTTFDYEPNFNQLASFTDARDEFIRNYLSQLLKMTGGNVSQAARMAKRNRTDFYKLLSRHQLDPEVFKHSTT